MQGNILLSIGTPVGLIAAADLFVVSSPFYSLGLQPSAGYGTPQSHTVVLHTAGLAGAVVPVHAMHGECST